MNLDKDQLLSTSNGGKFAFVEGDNSTRILTRHFPGSEANDSNCTHVLMSWPKSNILEPTMKSSEAEQSKGQVSQIAFYLVGVIFSAATVCCATKRWVIPFLRRKMFPQ